MAALCIALSGTGCGGAPPAATDARGCGGHSGSFCLTAGRAIDSLTRSGSVAGCRAVAPGAMLPAPLAAVRCTTADGTPLRLALFQSADVALRAQPSMIVAAGARPVPDRVVMANNVIAVADRLTRQSVHALRAAERLGDRAG